jgi:putative hydrolase of the HAD superfamily
VGEISSEAFFQGLKELLGLPVPLQKVQAAWDSLIVDFLPGVRELMREVKESHPLYALSNTNPSHIDLLDRNFPDMNLFDELFTSTGWRMRKPNPEIYEKLIATLNLEPQEILFVDDRPENIEGARAVGILAEECKDSVERLREIFVKHEVLR